MYVLRFYSTLLGSPIRVRTQDQQQAGQPIQAEVNMGHPGTKLIFQERKELGSTFTEKVGGISVLKTTSAYGLLALAPWLYCRSKYVDITARFSQ
eukprot:scaffold158727_cov24-Tisochrysis_lutea.AAC.1